MNQMNQDVNLLTLRVFTEKDAAYGHFVAYCLETGTIATADDPETVLEMMFELLYDDVVYAMKNKDFRNLFSSPAPYPIWGKWKESAGRTKPIQKRLEVRTDNTTDYVDILIGS